MIYLISLVKWDKIATKTQPKTSNKCTTFPPFPHLALSVCPPLSQSRKMIEMPFSFNIGFKYLLRCSRATSPAAAATWNPFWLIHCAFCCELCTVSGELKQLQVLAQTVGVGWENINWNNWIHSEVCNRWKTLPFSIIVPSDHRSTFWAKFFSFDWIRSGKKESKRNAEQAKVPVNHPLIETNGCLISHTTRLEPNVFSSRKHSEHSVLVHQSSKVKERIVENSLNWTRLIGIVSSLPGCEEQIPRFRHWGGQVLSCAQSSGEAKAGRNMATNKNGQLV